MSEPDSGLPRRAALPDDGSAGIPAESSSNESSYASEIPSSTASSPSGISASRSAESSPSNSSETSELPVPAESPQKTAAGATAKKKLGWKRLFAILLPVLLIAMFFGWRYWTYRAAGTLSDAPVWTPEEPLPDKIPPLLKLPDGCPTNPKPFVANKFIMDRQNITIRVLSLGLDSKGAAAAPPVDGELRLIGWFNQGPKPGSDKGKVLLTAHTFANKVALGNELNDGLMSEGDIVRMQDDAGNTACYQYTRAAKIWVKDYDPNSTAIYDNNGKPEIAIVVCADWNPVIRVAESRIVYYYRLLTSASE